MAGRNGADGRPEGGARSRSAAQRPRLGDVPWRVTNDAKGCEGWAVVKKDSGKVVACHKSRSAANAQLKALYANEAQTAAAVGGLARELLEGSNGQLGLTAARTFDESRVRRYPKGTPVSGKAGGGRFAPGDVITGRTLVGDHAVEGEVVGENRFGPIVETTTGETLTIKDATAQHSETSTIGLEERDYDLVRDIEEERLLNEALDRAEARKAGIPTVTMDTVEERRQWLLDYFKDDGEEALDVVRNADPDDVNAMYGTHNVEAGESIIPRTLRSSDPELPKFAMENDKRDPKIAYPEAKWLGVATHDAAGNPKPYGVLLDEMHEAERAQGYREPPFTVQVQGEWSGPEFADVGDYDIYAYDMEHLSNVLSTEIPQGVVYQIFDEDGRLLEESSDVRGSRWRSQEPELPDDEGSGIFDAEGVDLAQPPKPSGYHDMHVAGQQTFRGGAWDIDVGQLPDGRWSADFSSAAGSPGIGGYQRQYFATQAEAVKAAQDFLGISPAAQAGRADRARRPFGAPSQKDIENVAMIGGEHYTLGDLSEGQRKTIAKFLMNKGHTPAEAAAIMLSKHSRWADDAQGAGIGKPFNSASFRRYYEGMSDKRMPMGGPVGDWLEEGRRMAVESDMEGYADFYGIDPKDLGIEDVTFESSSPSLPRPTHYPAPKVERIIEYDSDSDTENFRGYSVNANGMGMIDTEKVGWDTSSSYGLSKTDAEVIAAHADEISAVVEANGPGQAGRRDKLTTDLAKGGDIWGVGKSFEPRPDLAAFHSMFGPREGEQPRMRITAKVTPEGIEIGDYDYGSFKETIPRKDVVTKSFESSSPALPTFSYREGQILQSAYRTEADGPQIVKVASPQSFSAAKKLSERGLLEYVGPGEYHVTPEGQQRLGEGWKWRKVDQAKFGLGERRRGADEQAVQYVEVANAKHDPPIPTRRDVALATTVKDWSAPTTEAELREQTRRIRRAARGLKAGLTAAVAIPMAPPRDWFKDPGLSRGTPLTVTADGRVYGHLALWDACHIGDPSGPGVCVAPPRSGTGYTLFHLGELETAEGDIVPVGKITLGTGHASLQASRGAATAHYDNTGSVVADVRAGEDQHGIWINGALRPNVTPAQVRELRAAGVSGDWRRYRNQLELVAALAVNVPGFPIPRVAALVAPELEGDERMTLVAAGLHHPLVPGLMTDDEAHARLEALALLAGVGGDPIMDLYFPR